MLTIYVRYAYLSCDWAGQFYPGVEGMEGAAKRNTAAQKEGFGLAPTLATKTRADFELVIARYDEDIAWTNAYTAFRTVYNKGVHMDVSGVCIPLENKGHLADTILRHIISRYNSLATTTFFAHGSVNYRDDQHFAQHQWDDFCRVSTNHVKFIEETQMPAPRGRVYGYPHTWDEVHQILFDAPMTGRFSWGRGTWISVGCDRIHSQPKSFWERWLRWLHSPMPDGSQPTLEDYRKRDIYMERFFVKALRMRPYVPP